MKKKLLRISSIVLLVILILAVSTLAAGAVAKSNLAKQHPAPGQLVDVGGYKLHLNCVGEGSPTVILAAGLGDFSVVWDKVQSEIAKTTRVCSYDRAGYGWSDPSPEPVSASLMAEELHTLLVNANVPGPYVMVGHSLSGVIVRVFAYNYPEEVAGMVLVDSTHEEQLLRLTAAVPKFGELLQSGNEKGKGQNQFFGFLSSTGIMALMPQAIPNPAGFDEDTFEQCKAIWATTGFFETLVAETDALENILADTRSMHITSFGDLPLIVLSAGLFEPIPTLSEAENQKFHETQQELQSSFLMLSSESKQIIAKQSGHFIHSDQPDIVIDAIQEILHAVQE